MSVCSDDIAWYRVRDTLFGENYETFDITKALRLAAVCNHPDAVWLTNLFAKHGNVCTKSEVRQVFLGCINDTKAAYFAASLDDYRDVQLEPLLRTLAVSGYAYAQAEMARTIISNFDFGTNFYWAEKAAAQKERNGFYWLAICYLYGSNCRMSEELAKKNFLNAAMLGSRSAMCKYALMLEETDTQRVLWIAKAGYKLHQVFFNLMNSHMEYYKSTLLNGPKPSPMTFAFGRALVRQYHWKDRGTITYVNADQAIQYFDFQLKEYRRAVDTWTIVGLRNNVVKDIRKLIGKIIWDARDEAEY